MTMSTRKKDTKAASTIVAIAEQGDRLKAVCLGRHGSAFELLWTKSSDVGSTNWRSFAADCGLSTGQMPEQDAAGERIIAGFDSAAVVFYRIDVPAAKKPEVDAMVRLQAEARLPLPAEQIEMTWQRAPAMNGQVSVTVAAARTEQLGRFVESVRGIEPAQILLDCEGLLYAWREVCAGGDEVSVIASVGPRSTQLCLVENNRLANAAKIDMGTEDFSRPDDADEQSEIAERFAQDIGAVLELFGFADPQQAPIYVFSDGSRILQQLIESLNSTRLNVKAALPEEARLRTSTPLGLEGIYEYRVPIGLALMGLAADAEHLNIFERLYTRPVTKAKTHWLHSPRIVSALSVAVFALLIIVLYFADVTGEKHLSGLRAGSDIVLYRQRRRLLKMVALQRPDMLDLLQKVNGGEGDGIQLNSLDFKKGRLVNIIGQSDSPEQIYKFQKSLLDKKGITEVKVQNQSMDKESKKIKFTMTFHYRNFTKRKAAISPQGRRPGRL